MLFLLAGCGQKGALFLPDSEESAGINQITAGVMDN